MISNSNDFFGTQTNRAINTKKTMIKGLFVTQFAVLLFLEWLSLTFPLNNIHFGKWLLLVYIVCDTWIFLKKDMKNIISFNYFNVLLLFLECLIFPFIYFQLYMPSFFASSWLYFLVGFYGLIIRQVLMQPFGIYKKFFCAHQKYLREGIYWVGVPPSKSRIKVKLYAGTVTQKRVQKIIDLICMTVLVYFLHGAYISLDNHDWHPTVENYAIICSLIIVSLLLIQFSVLRLYDFILILKACKDIKKKVVLGSDPE